MESLGICVDWILKEKSKVQSNQFIAIAGCPSVKNQYKIFILFWRIWRASTLGEPKHLVN
jgi:hypothetical protein